jgi:hypothetical protein
MDAAAKMARRDLLTLNQHGEGEPEYTSIRTTGRKGFGIEESIKWVQNELISIPVKTGSTTVYKCKLWIDVDHCPMLADEIGQYEVDKNGHPLKDQQDHHMDGMRYLNAIHHLGGNQPQASGGVAIGERKRAVKGHGEDMWRDPSVVPEAYGASPVAIVPRIRRF